MSNSGDKKPGERAGAGAKAGDSTWAGVDKGTQSRSSSESVPQPDQTRSLDFTGLAAAAARARPGPAAKHSAIERAAILYADGKAEHAKDALLRELGTSQPRSWMMLFELHRELGERVEFEVHAREFKSKFGRPAPAWRAPAPEGEEAALRTGSGAFVGLSGKLSAQSAPQLERLLAVAQQQHLLRIDFSRLQGADGPGCRLLFDALRAIRQGGAEAVLTGESELLGALAKATAAAGPPADRAFWLLRLEILQSQGRRAEFEGVAQQYAKACATPAPQFEARAASRPLAPAAGGGGDVLHAPAEIVNNPEAFFRAILAAAGTRAEVVVDCSALRRIDVPSAQTLRNVAAKLAEHGKRLELRHANLLVVALFEVIGVSARATVVPRP
ncbi:MAG TPA: STAS domain-containing protein [Burkholderiales bacterium]|nr:STAS domain-containing protein [Burkholderiales bacterium]